MKKIILIIILLLLLVVTPSATFAQGMMGSPSSSIDNAAIQSQRQEEQEGKRFLDDLRSKTITCSQLKDADFEKIGEYFMGQAVGDTSRHIAMNNMAKSMMGDSGEAQMHVAWGRRGSGCDTTAAFPAGMMGSAWPAGMAGMMGMMGGFGPSGWGQGMMGWNGVGNWYGIFGTVTSLLVICALVLANIWLWKQIRKK